MKSRAVTSRLPTSQHVRLRSSSSSWVVAAEGSTEGNPLPDLSWLRRSRGVWACIGGTVAPDAYHRICRPARRRIGPVEPWRLFGSSCPSTRSRPAAASWLGSPRGGGQHRCQAGPAPLTRDPETHSEPSSSAETRIAVKVLFDYSRTGTVRHYPSVSRELAVAALEEVERLCMPIVIDEDTLLFGGDGRLFQHVEALKGWKNGACSWSPFRNRVVLITADNESRQSAEPRQALISPSY